MSLRTSLFGSLQVSDAAKASSYALGERARTVIGITSTAVDGACGLTIDLENTGASVIRQLPKMDVIVQFPTGNNQALGMAYSTAAPNLGEWTVVSISGLFEPDDWNPGENLTIQAQVPLLESGGGIVTVGTPNGIVSQATFSGLLPC